MFIRREQGLVQYQWQDLVTIEIQSPAKTILNWNVTVLKDAPFDREAVSEAFKKLVAPKDPPVWESYS